VVPLLTDTHCHLDFNDYDKDRDQVLERAWATGVDRILNPGVDIFSSQKAVRLASTEPRIFTAVGIHPNSSRSWNHQSLESLEMIASNPKVVAIGEIGLDYYRDRAPKEHQQFVFTSQLELAKQLKLPVIVHTRNASLEDRSCIKDTIEILSGWKTELTFPGVIHSYSGNISEAEKLISHSFLIGITGPVTFKKAVELQDVVRAIPLDQLLIETDGPFLSPQPHRGKRNEPAYVRFIAEKIGELQGKSLDEVSAKTSNNANCLFGWGRMNNKQC
jgi:TatD DNase family protein